jgi:hypothetical protein
VWGNGYILDQGTDATAQQESSNPIHQRKEQLLGQLLYLPVYANTKVFRRKHIASEKKQV